MKLNKIKKGISLIVLIVTIIVVIILAAVVILTLSKNNPIESAKEAAFKEDIRAYQDELNMYITKEYQSLAGQRDSKITATGYEKDSTSEEYNNSVYKYLSSFKKKYENKIAIENDEIVYIGRDKKEREWTNNIVKMNPILTVKYVYENGEEAAPTYEETVTDGAYEVDSPIIDGYEPDHYTVSDKIDKDTEIIVTYYPWSEGLAYEELTDGTYTVAGIGTFAGENLVIPRKYNGKDVTEIKSNAFYGNQKLKSVVIQNNINKINSQCFAALSNVEYIYANCKNILGSSIYSIRNLTEIIIGENVERIDEWGVRNNGNLQKLIVCSNSVDINGEQFVNSNISEIIVNKGNTKYQVIDDVLYSIDKKMIYMYPQGKEGSFSIPKEVEVIGTYAFANNKYLQEITIPNTVNVIKSDAFKYCKNISNVIVDAKQIYGNVFYSIDKLEKITIGKNVKNLGTWCIRNNSNLKVIEYLGSMEEWNAVTKSYQWKVNDSVDRIICTDGEIEL